MKRWNNSILVPATTVNGHKHKMLISLIIITCTNIVQYPTKPLVFRYVATELKQAIYTHVIIKVYYWLLYKVNAL